MKYIRRIITFVHRASRIASLGTRLTDRMHIFYAYVSLSLIRALGGNYAARPLTSFFVSLDSASARVYIKGLLDLYILEGVFLGREYDVPVTDARVIFDLGSNTGITLVFFKLKHPHAKIFAFEPDPNNAEILHRNVEAFGEDVIVYEAAVVGEPVDSISFFVSKEHWSSSGARKKDSDREVKVRAVMLDDVVKEHAISQVDILKFDIEGAEYGVFSSFKGLGIVRYIAGEVHEDLMGVPSEQFYALLKDFSYRSTPLHRDRLTVNGGRRT